MSAKTVKVRRGKPVNLYLRDADIAKVRELMVAVASNGDRVSESLIVRAAIHAANANRSFYEAYKQVASADLRFRPD